MKRKLLSFLVLIVLLEFSLLVHSSSSVEIDATTVVSKVIDGDTFDTTTESRIRLADVNTPERGESGYYEAKNFLIGLVYNRTVHLDIDDIYKIDKYDRLVCVVYVDYNSTHLKNVNKALLVEGYAVIWDFDNEFNPYTWSLYCPREESPKAPSDAQLEWLIIAVIVVIAIVGTAGLLLHRKRKPSAKPSHRLVR